MTSLSVRCRYLAVVYAMLLLGCPALVFAQTTIEGVVTDATTKEKLPFVSVAVPGAGIGTNTDENGRFKLQIPTQYTSVVFTSVGYGTVTKTIAPGESQQINVQLTTTATALKEVVVQGSKAPRYRNIENPAVALIREVIEHK